MIALLRLTALLGLVGSAAARSPRPPTVRVQLVICRLGAESISWATDAFQGFSGGVVDILVMNGGAPLAEGPIALQAGVSEHALSAYRLVPHESACYLEHIYQTQLGTNPVFSPKSAHNFVVYSPATPRCGATAPSATACTLRLLSAVRNLALGKATVEPHGFAPVEPVPLAPFGHGLPHRGASACLAAECASPATRSLGLAARPSGLL
jgi:hypothetical protein